MIKSIGIAKVLIGDLLLYAIAMGIGVSQMSLNGVSLMSDRNSCLTKFIYIYQNAKCGSHVECWGWLTFFKLTTGNNNLYHIILHYH